MLRTSGSQQYKYGENRKDKAVVIIITLENNGYRIHDDRAD